MLAFSLSRTLMSAGLIDGNNLPDLVVASNSKGAVYWLEQISPTQWVQVRVGWSCGSFWEEGSPRLIEMLYPFVVSTVVGAQRVVSFDMYGAETISLGDLVGMCLSLSVTENEAASQSTGLTVDAFLCEQTACLRTTTATWTLWSDGRTWTCCGWKTWEARRTSCFLENPIGW